jgi:hypothetical protein
VSNHAGKLHFAAKAREDARVAGDLGADGFECNAAVQFKVKRLVDLAHASLADEANDLKAASHDRSRA